MKLCSYGCGQEAKFQFKNGKICCSGNVSKCPETKRKRSKKKKGRTKANDDSVRSQAEKMTGRTKENNESTRRMSEKLIGRTKETHEYIRKATEKILKKKMGRTKKNNEGIRKAAEKMTGRTKETHEYLKRAAEKRTGRKRPDVSKRMKNGGAAYANSFIGDDSKPEGNLFVLACKILPRPIHKYPIYRVGKGKRSFNVDIGDASLGIILEYDGYYHFNTEERKKYHRKRQKEIEEDGWVFLRYTIFDKFPTLEQLKEDIQKVLKNGGN